MRFCLLLCITFALGAGPGFPVKVSPNHRYLVDQNEKPFLIAGESPQALMVNCSIDDAKLFFSNRHSHGFNAVWINLLRRKGTGGRGDGSTYDGIQQLKNADGLS